MKSTTLGSLACVMVAAAFCSVARAADAPSGGQTQLSAKEQVTGFFKHSGALNLSDDQRRQCDALAKECGEQARVKGADIDAIKSEELSRIVGILNKDQIALLTKLQETAAPSASRRGH
jgi:fructose-1,6-bisphosphatase